MEFEPQQADNQLLETALNRLHGEQVMQFMPGGGVRIYNFVETGETADRTIGAGKAQYVFTVPVNEPLLSHEYGSLAEMLTAPEFHAPEPYAGWRAEQPVGHDIPDPAYLRWKRRLPTAEAILEQARQKQEGPEELDLTETLPCGNCRGKTTFHLNCGCTYGGLTHVDLEGNAVSERDKGQPDPDCDTCHGSGSYDNPCPICNGSGAMLKHPLLRLINDITREESLVLMDVPTMLARNELTLHQTDVEEVYADGRMVAGHSIVLQVDKFLRGKFEQIRGRHDHSYARERKRCS